MRIGLMLAFALVSGSALADPSGKMVLYTSQTPEVAQQTADVQAAKPEKPDY